MRSVFVPRLGMTLKQPPVSNLTWYSYGIYLVKLLNYDSMNSKIGTHTQFHVLRGFEFTGGFHAVFGGVLLPTLENARETCPQSGATACYTQLIYLCCQWWTDKERPDRSAANPGCKWRFSLRNFLAFQSKALFFLPLDPGWGQHPNLYISFVFCFVFAHMHPGLIYFASLSLSPLFCVANLVSKKVPIPPCHG